MNIREMRAQLGDTQSEFSARYHIPFRTVQNWETGMRKPPEYVSDLLEQRIKEDLTNRKTLSLPKYDPQKKDLPSRSSYVGALSWLQAVRDCIGEPVVFALDNALMCQGNFGGRSDEYIVWVYGDDSVMKFNGVVVLGNRIGAQNIKNRNGLLYTDFNRTVYDALANENILDMLVRGKICSSKREAREMISAGAISINGNKETNLDKIDCKTLILCGIKDKQNMENAKLLNKTIKNSSFKTVSNASHVVNVDNPKDLSNMIYDFWREK